MIVTLPWTRPPLTSNRTRGNVYARANEVKRAKAEAVSAIRAASLRRIVGANVTLHYMPATWHRRDADGMCPTLKVCLDALVAEGVLPDDSFVHVPKSAHHIHDPDTTPLMWLELTEIHEYYGGEPA